ncbi:hypothetical protein ACLMJK_005275 [Lecanora helva]
MSSGRLLPTALATVIGITTGIVIFQPAFREEKEQKDQANMTDLKEVHSPSAEEQVRKTEEAVANAGGATTIPKDAPRWSEAQAGQFNRPENFVPSSESPSPQSKPPEKP